MYVFDNKFLSLNYCEFYFVFYIDMNNLRLSDKLC